MGESIIGGKEAVEDERVWVIEEIRKLMTGMAEGVVDEQVKAWVVGK
jgi:trehalose utilization protein